MKCWLCNTELVWGGDQDIEIDEHDLAWNEGGHTILTNLSCPQCNAFVEVYHGGETND
tara:strand:+ start:837 stop:1010 length:174 start_codon:yes stop_codon:yes gene_type:complete